MRSRCAVPIAFALADTMHPIPTVRRATSADVTNLLGLVEEYWRFENIPGFDPARVGLQLRRLLTEAHLGSGWIALNDGMPVGYLLAVYVFSLEHLGLTAEIDEFFVLPKMRAIGIGGKLVQAAEAAFVAAGCTSVALQLARSNDSGRAFYLCRGYSPRSGYELLDKILTVD